MIIVRAIRIVPAVSFVVLFIISIKVVECETVVAGNEVHRSVLTLIRRIQIRRAADALYGGVCKTVIALEKAAQIIAVFSIPLCPAIP